MLTRLLPIALLGSLILAACGGSGEPQNTPQPVGRGPALQTFLGQAYESGWFAEGDPIDVEIVEVLVAMVKEGVKISADVRFVESPVPGMGGVGISFECEDKAKIEEAKTRVAGIRAKNSRKDEFPLPNIDQLPKDLGIELPDKPPEDKPKPDWRKSQK